MANNPNGIIAQTNIKLVKQDTHDDGKSGATIQNVKEVFKQKDDASTDDDNNNDDNNNDDNNNDGGKAEFCIECVLNADIKMNIHKIAIIISKQTDVSVKAAILSLSDFFVRVANDAGHSKALQSLRNLETDVGANPIVLNKIGAVAKLYEGGYDHAKRSFRFCGG